MPLANRIRPLDTRTAIDPHAPRNRASDSSARSSDNSSANCRVSDDSHSPGIGATVRHRFAVGAGSTLRSIAGRRGTESILDCHSKCALAIVVVAIAATYRGQSANRSRLRVRTIGEESFHRLRHSTLSWLRGVCGWIGFAAGTIAEIRTFDPRPWIWPLHLSFSLPSVSVQIHYH